MDLRDENFPVGAERGCEPEWVQVKPLLSYCMKSLAPADVAGSAPDAATAREKRCVRKCVFGFRMS